MRTLRDRIRHTILFELLAIIISVPLAAILSGQSALKISAIAIFFSIFAMLWNLLYNWLFDLVEAKYFSVANRSFKIRIVHALGFEAGLLLPSVFIIAWWLNIKLLAALGLDIGFTVFFLIYALVFNWGYDVIFPINKKCPALVTGHNDGLTD